MPYIYILNSKLENPRWFNPTTCEPRTIRVYSVCECIPTAHPIRRDLILFSHIYGRLLQLDPAATFTARTHRPAENAGCRIHIPHFLLPTRDIYYISRTRSTIARCGMPKQHNAHFYDYHYYAGYRITTRVIAPVSRDHWSRRVDYHYMRVIPRPLVLARCMPQTPAGPRSNRDMPVSGPPGCGCHHIPRGFLVTLMLAA